MTNETPAQTLERIMGLKPVKGHEDSFGMIGDCQRLIRHQRVVIEGLRLALKKLSNGDYECTHGNLFTPCNECELNIIQEALAAVDGKEWLV